MGSKQAMIDFVVNWCNDDSHGYSQDNRWGPDCDCSSLMYMAAAHAGYGVPTSGTRYTGTMVRDFTAAGFQAVPFDGNLYDCEPGCIALNTTHHVEMFVGWGQLGGAHIDEHGGVQGCCQGDQAGNEVSVGPAYTPSYGWDYILVPPADSDSGSAQVPMESKPIIPEYRVMNRESGWLSWMTGLNCACPCGDDFAGEPGCWIYDFEARNLGPNGWYKILRADGSESVNSSGNRDVPITGLVVYYDTPNPDGTGYYKAFYQVYWLGDDPGWGKWESDDEDGGAGKDENSPLDMVRLTICKA